MKRKLSQHFLIDKNILKKIDKQLIAIKNRDVCEIGGGRGDLTECIIANNPRKLIIIEKDKILYDILMDKFNYNHIEIINNDIRNIELNCNIVVSSVPYHITRDILKIIVFNKIKMAFLIIQKEFAQKVINKVFLPISILINTFYNTDIKFYISKNSFSPCPKVESAFLIMNKNDIENISINDYWQFLIKLCSSKNRIIKNVFQVDNNKRIRELTLQEIINIYKIIKQKQLS